MPYQAPRGTHDILPGEIYRWQAAEQAFLRLVTQYGYREIRTPIFEDTELFVRTSGDTSEVVTKQMYSFKDKGDRDLTLKPEGTAPVMRAYLEHRLAGDGQPVRLCYVATPVFRYERPQKGRYRQHHQLGCELIGVASPEADAEIIEIAIRTYQALGIGSLQVKLNSIGRAATREAYREALLAHAQPVLKDMDPEDRARAERNPLRMLDSKDPVMIEALQNAPKVLDYLEPESKSAFDSLCSILTEAQIPFVISPEIVRGLDYYTDTVFEVHSTALGAQTALCGGGRYDGLLKALGGPPTPSVGFGMGLERALLVQESQGALPTEPRIAAFLIAADDAGRSRLRTLAAELRSSGISATYDMDGRSLKAQIKLADRIGAQYAVILGEKEIADRTATVKELSSGDQTVVEQSGLAKHLAGEPK